MNENIKHIDGETKTMLLSALKKGYFDKETVKHIHKITRIYTDRFCYKAGLINIERCFKKPIELDREIKLILLNVFKKGYFEKKDVLPIIKKIDEVTQIGSQEELRACMFDLLEAAAKDDED